MLTTQKQFCIKWSINSQQIFSLVRGRFVKWCERLSQSCCENNHINQMPNLKNIKFRKLTVHSILLLLMTLRSLLVQVKVKISVKAVKSDFFVWSWFPCIFYDFAATALRPLSGCLSLLLRYSKSNSVVSAECFGMNSTFIKFLCLCFS